MSSEEPFNYIEHKIKEAAENNEIVFEESSWKKMELLLDKEPRRKPFVWWWFLMPLAIIAGAGIIIWTYEPEQKNKIIAMPKANKMPSKKVKSTSVIADINYTKSNIDNNILLTPKKVVINLNKHSNSTLKHFQKINKSSSSIYSQQHFKNTLINVEENIIDKDNKNLAKPKANFNVHTSVDTNDEAILTIIKRDSIKIAIVKPINTDTTAVVKEKKIIKKKEGKLSKFYVLGSAGADVSSTILFAFNNNTATLKYGLALGYGINKKLSVQAGFYAGKKKYIAKQGEYNFKTGSYYNTVKVVKVDAECIVYEIPVSVRYNVLQMKSINIYSGVGLSSYIMKNEDYVVHFIRNNMPYAREWYYTGNQHLFSTLILIAGAEKQLTKNVVLQVEPSVGVPLKGVGEGGVKLFSTGLQLGLKYYPFK